MGLLDKVKGILFDEEEVELPEIKKEPPAPKRIIKETTKEKVEENPIREIKVPKDDFSDKDNYKAESTFTFPIDFEDDDVVEPIKSNPKLKHVDPTPFRKQEVRNYSDFLNKKEEKKKFKPTPIISPVYGVLDQNYKKEDVIVKKEVLRSPNELTLEEVRKRAFGSLEDELEQTLTNENENSVIKIKEKLSAKRETTIEPKKEKIEKPIDKKKTIGELIEEEDVELELPQIESINDEDIEYTNNDNELKEEPTNSIEDLLNDEKKNTKEDEIDEDEADLFSLIDSMYEEKGE